jgi:hypothetical protein
LEKGKERLRIGGKEFPGSTHEGLLVTLIPRSILLEGSYWSTRRKG